MTAARVATRHTQQRVILQFDQDDERRQLCRIKRCSSENP
jgi:hypothetical protein